MNPLSPSFSSPHRKPRGILVLMGAITAASVTVGGVAHPALAQEDFKPFVCVDLTDDLIGLNNIQSGYVRDVNILGQAVVNVVVNGVQDAVFLNPASAEYPPDTDFLTLAFLEHEGYAIAEATSISEDTGLGSLLITGYVKQNSENDPPRACYWYFDRDLPTDPWVQHFALVDFQNVTQHASIAWDVNDLNHDHYIVGQCTDSTGQESRAFRADYNDGDDTAVAEILHDMDDVNAAARAINCESEGYIVGESISSSGHWRSFMWGPVVGSDPQDWTVTLIHGSVSDWSGAFGVNDAYNACGWRWPNGDNYGPVSWSFVKDLGEDIGCWESYCTQEWTSHPITYFTPPNSEQIIIGAQGEDINNFDEVVVSYVDDQTSGAFLWRLITDELGQEIEHTTIRVNDLTLFFTDDSDPQNDPFIHHLYAVNDAGWMGGSFIPEGGDPDYPQPCLVIPYSTTNESDNPGGWPIPDYRVIIENGGPGFGKDLGGRFWLPDRSEAMRAGANDPPFNPDDANGIPDPDNDLADIIDSIQAVRITINNGDFRTWFIDYPEDYCGQITDDFVQWRDHDEEGSGTDGSEIILTHRTTRPDHETQDIIPTSPGTVLQDEFLMSWLLARCIDYVQVGNEMFGPGGVPQEGGSRALGALYIQQGQLSGCPTYEGLLHDVPADCFVEAIDLLMDWIHQQNKAIVYGSALRGRPLRVYLPAFSLIEAQDAIGKDADGDHTIQGNRIAYALCAFVEYANRNQCIIDQHMRYDRYSFVGDVWEALTDPTASNSAWTQPDQIGVLETAPDPSEDWLNGVDSHGQSTREVYITDYYGALCGKQAPQDSWYNYVESEWKLEQFGEPGFRVSDVYDQHFSYGALHALWGNYQQSAIEETLTCDKVHPYHVPPLKASLFDNVGADKQWTVFKAGLLNAVAPYLIPDFSPNAEGCPCYYAPFGGE